MLESIFFLFLLVSLALIIFAFGKRDASFLALASILLFGTGLLILDQSPTSGIEETTGFDVNAVGDNNNDFSVEFKTTFRNSGNDPSLNILGNVFTWGGAAGLIISLGFLIESHRRKGG